MHDPESRPRSEASATSYLQHYGLAADPFAADPEFPFFGGGGRSELLEQLIHLCQFSAGLVTVTAGSGVGKTRLARALYQTLDSDDCCLLRAEPTLERSALLEALAAELGIPWQLDASGDHWLARLHSFHQWVSESDSAVVLLIDDAHRLSDASLEALLGLLSAQLQSSGDERESRLRLALFGEPQLVSRITAVDPQLPAQHFRLDPLNPDQAASYLNFRMEMCDYLGRPLFPRALVEPWWRSAQGDLGVLHRAAADWLASTRQPNGVAKAVSSVKAASSVLPLPHILAVAGLLTLLLMLVLYRSGRDTEHTREVVLPLPTEAPTDVMAPADTVPREELVVASGRVDEPRVQQSVSDPEPTDTLSPVVEPLPEAEPEVEPAVDPALPAERVAPVPVEREPAPAAVAPRLDDLTEDEQVLLSWRSGDYTLQLLGAGSEQTVREYVSRQPNRGQLLVYRTRRQGNDWFVIVTGRFDSAEAARRAIEELPGHQRGEGPWPRPLAGVQEDISSARRR